MARHRKTPDGAAVGSFYDRMTTEQRAELDEGIAQAERGQVVPAEKVFDRLAKRFGFAKSRRMG
jgi:predicted transcriptional regulator